MRELDPQERFGRASVARLATVGPDGAPHLVAIVFALHDGVVYTAVDAKPKRSPRLRRLVNIEHQPQVSLLVDHYTADWTQLWWVRADGLAKIHTGGPQRDRGYEALRAKYPQYETVALNGPVVAITVHHWASWHP